MNIFSKEIPRAKGNHFGASSIVRDGAGTLYPYQFRYKKELTLVQRTEPRCKIKFNAKRVNFLFWDDYVRAVSCEL